MDKMAHGDSKSILIIKSFSSLCRLFVSCTDNLIKGLTRLPAKIKQELIQYHDMTFLCLPHRRNNQKSIRRALIGKLRQYLRGNADETRNLSRPLGSSGH